jgi:hypothetical protein
VIRAMTKSASNQWTVSTVTPVQNRAIGGMALLNKFLFFVLDGRNQILQLSLASNTVSIFCGSQAGTNEGTCGPGGTARFQNLVDLGVDGDSLVVLSSGGVRVINTTSLITRFVAGVTVSCMCAATLRI